MPLTLESKAPPFSPSSLRERRVRRGVFADRGRRLNVGLVNNMPDAAVAATERQFASLVEAASGDFDVRLSLFDLETLPRSHAARDAMREDYRRARTLPSVPRDAIIVTGAEPRADTLRNEPYWDELGFVLDWADTHALSTLHSCLAAHVAVQRRDGIGRRRLGAKCSGIFAVDVLAKHELTAGLEAGFQVPHSRWNGLDAAELTAKGYQVLTRSKTRRRRHVRAQFAQPAGIPARAILNTTPTRSPANTAATRCASCAKRSRRRRVCCGRLLSPSNRRHAHRFPRSRQGASGARAGPPLSGRCVLALDFAPWREAGVRLTRNWLIGGGAQRVKLRETPTTVCESPAQAVRRAAPMDCLESTSRDDAGKRMTAPHGGEDAAAYRRAMREFAVGVAIVAWRSPASSALAARVHQGNLSVADPADAARLPRPRRADADAPARKRRFLGQFPRSAPPRSRRCLRWPRRRAWRSALRAWPLDVADHRRADARRRSGGNRLPGRRDHRAPHACNRHWRDGRGAAGRRRTGARPLALSLREPGMSLAAPPRAAATTARAHGSGRCRSPTRRPARSQPHAGARRQSLGRSVMATRRR